MRIIESEEFDSYWKNNGARKDDEALEGAVKEIIAAVRDGGDAAVRRFASRFDRCSPPQFEVPLSVIEQADDELRSSEPELTAALELAADHIKHFALKQREQFFDFECEMEKGLITGQRVIPVQRSAVYVPAGRFPLFSSALMGLIPAFCAGVEEVLLASPPAEDGLPDRKILAAASIALKTAASEHECKLRVFALGGAQAIAALALGTETIPRVDVIVGPGNKYVATAKRLLFGEVGIDFIAGPTDVLIIADDPGEADLVAADMIAQAEHDPDAHARVLVSNREIAEQIAGAVEKRLAALTVSASGDTSNGGNARASLDSGGLIIIYQNKEEATCIANAIAPEHLELQVSDADTWVPLLKNYGSLFIGGLSAEVLGDYSAGINHTLPTSGNARFSGGLSVRHFLKTVTSLRCTPGDGFEKARNAAELLARAEGLEGHAQSAVARGLLGIQRPHKTTFDNIADSYEEELKNSLGKYGRRDIAIFAEYKIKIIKSKLFKTPANVLEFGCGTGRNTLFLKKWFPESNIYGCDISEKSLEIASKANPTVQYDKITTPADLFEVYKEPFDCIFISNVFHHIPFNEHQIWLDALYRITSEEGIVFIFEHNPYNPITKRVFSSSEIDKGAFMLKPSYCQKLLQNTNFTNINRRYTLFFLWRNSFFESVERMLYWLPLGAQYYVWGKKCKNLTTSQ